MKNHSFDELHQLVKKAQEQGHQTNNRRLFLSQLIRAIQHSGILSPDRCQCPREVYNEAVYDTLREVCQKIDSYDPSTGTVSDWIEDLLLQAIDRHNTD